ncbi:MAG: nucleotide exchange factor GrpE [Bacteroidia bacterium]
MENTDKLGDNQEVNNEEVSENTDTNQDETAENAETRAENGSNDSDPESKYNELNDKYLRLYSEFDNYRKRTQKERVDLIKSAGEDVLKSIIPVIDDFERAIKANENVTDVDAVKEGLKMIYHKLENITKIKGLEAFNSMNEPFNDELMEAITHIPAPNEEMKGKVVDEVEKGYKLGDKVVRFAKVVVGS